MPSVYDTPFGANPSALPTGALVRDNGVTAINNLGGITTIDGDQGLVSVDPTGQTAANAFVEAGMPEKMPANLPGSPNAYGQDVTTPAAGGNSSSNWDKDAAALWQSIGQGFDTSLKARQDAINAQTSGLQRRNIEIGALRGNSGLGGAAQAGGAQAVLTGAQMQSDAIGDTEKNKLGAKMAMLQMYMDRAKADQNLEAQKQIQQMMSETEIALELARGGGLDYTQMQDIMK